MDDLFRSARLGGGLEGGDMPLSAAEVRRRGDRIRRRRNALVAGGAALAVAAVAVPVFAIGSGGPNAERDRIAGDPETTVQALTQDDLLTDDDTVYSDGADWFAASTVEGEGGAPGNPCADASFADLGATTVLQRNFELRNLDAGAPEMTGDHLNETIAEFPSAKAAARAQAEVVGWLADCDTASTPGYRFVQEREPVSGGPGTIVDAQWDAPGDPYGGYFAETGTVVVGDRLAVLSSHVLGSDYNFLPEEGGTPVDRMLPLAAERLAPED